MDKTIHSSAYGTFLKLLTQARKTADLTQIELAEKLGESQSFVSKCERGERRLDVIEALAFCKAIGIKFSTFVEQVEKESGSKFRRK